jgi:hypothetical protein
MECRRLLAYKYRLSNGINTYAEAYVIILLHEATEGSIMGCSKSVVFKPGVTRRHVRGHAKTSYGVCKIEKNTWLAIGDLDIRTFYLGEPFLYPSISYNFVLIKYLSSFINFYMILLFNALFWT